MPREDLSERLTGLDRPNLVLVIVDMLRADYTSAHGFESDTTPELRSWAERGVLFERLRAQSSWTKMSMASLFTSLWPRSHGIRDAQDGLADDALTLAEILHEGGYATYGVQTNGWLHQSFGFQQGFDRYLFPMGGGDKRFGAATLWSHADRVVEEAERVIEAHDASQPFFLYLHFMDVHEYAAPPEFKGPDEDSRDAYLASVRWVDDALRRVREALERQGYLGHTVMFFGSDHGETFGEHGVYGHARNVLTPVVWVPGVLRLPFATEPIRVSAQVRNLDLAPTLVELAGLEVPEGFEGRSLLPLVTGEAESEDRPAYAALGLPLYTDASVQTALNEGDWTYARNAEPGEGAPEWTAKGKEPGAEFLFDRRVDPVENVNLRDIETVQLQRMREILDGHLADASREMVEEDVRIDPKIAEKLRAMGYLQ